MNQCQHITKTPVHIKRLGNFVIDRSEWEDERGAFLWYNEAPCLYVADEGHEFCPRHEMEHAMERKS